MITNTDLRFHYCYKKKKVLRPYLVICRCFLRKTRRKRTSRLMSRMLRTARAEMAATLGFISLAAQGELRTDSELLVGLGLHMALNCLSLTYRRCWWWCVQVCWGCCSWSWWLYSCTRRKASTLKSLPRVCLLSEAHGTEKEEKSQWAQEECAK